MLAEDYLVLLHISTTADEHQVCVSHDTGEVIELSWLILRTEEIKSRENGSLDVTDESAKSVLVQPLSTPVTDLCTFTTGLSSKELAGACKLDFAIKLLEQAIEERIHAKQATFALVMLNSSDLQVQLVREAKEKHIKLPSYLLFPRVYNIQDEFRKWQGKQFNGQLVRQDSYASICEMMSVEKPRATEVVVTSNTLNGASSPAFRASDNIVMLSRIVAKLIAEIDTIAGLFSQPLDAGTDFRAFLKEESKVLHLSGLVSDTTQSELESWFTQHGGRPIAFWTLRTPDQHKATGIGYAIFATHEEAQESLLEMNGRQLSDRTICVSPSSLRILDRATEILTPFPPSKNRPRPGDWTCPSCGFSNFQRRTACFRCSYPVGAGIESSGPYYGMRSQMGPMPTFGLASTPQPTGRLSSVVGSNGMSAGSALGGSGGHVPFRAGDWSCQNCAYHNFARNSVCLKCSMPRQQQQHHIHQQSMNGMAGAYQGYDGQYRMDALTNDMSRQVL